MTSENLQYCNFCHTMVHVDTNYNDGTRICSICGQIFEKGIIDQHCEFRNFGESGSSDLARTGGAGDSLLLSSNPLLDTSIKVSKGAKGERNGSASRLKANERQELSTADKNKRGAFRLIGQFCQRLGFDGSGVESLARRYYDDFVNKHFDQKGNLKGHSTNVLVLATIWLAATNQGRSCDPDILTGLSGGKPRKSIFKARKLVATTLKLDLNKEAQNTLPTFVAQIIGQFKLANTVLTRCREVVKRVDESGVLGAKKPMTVAAGVVYFVCMFLTDEELNEKLAYRPSDTVAYKASISLAELSRKTRVSASSIEAVVSALEPQKESLLSGVEPRIDFNRTPIRR